MSSTGDINITFPFTPLIFYNPLISLNIEHPHRKIYKTHRQNITKMFQGFLSTCLLRLPHTPLRIKYNNNYSLFELTSFSF